jgi:hypothetical protein
MWAEVIDFEVTTHTTTCKNIWKSLTWMHSREVVQSGKKRNHE